MTGQLRPKIDAASCRVALAALSLVLTISTLLCATTAAFAVDAPPAPVILETDFLRYEIGADGRNVAFVDKTTGKDWCDRAAAPFFAHVRKAGNSYDSTKVALVDGHIAVDFGGTGIRVLLAVRREPHCLVFEVTEVTDAAVEELIFGDVSLTLKGKPGEPFAACALALNLQTNVPQIPGLNSRMQAACYARFGLVGARTAIVAAPQPLFRDVLKEAVSAAPDLPHSSLGGPWALDADINRGSYLIDTEGKLGPDTVEDWITLAKNLGITQIDFHTGKSLRFGDLAPNPALYPKGLDDVKAVVARLHAAGIAAGLHTYAFFIAKDSAWVTPVPDPRLAVDATFTLAGALTNDADSVLTQEPTKSMSTVTGFQIRNSVTLRIDDELVTYTGVSAEAPFGFTGCKRGAWGTTPAAHAKDAKLTHLKECFGLFVPDGDSTLFAEVAAKTAQIYNACGFDMIYLDALDGADILAGGLNAWHYGAKYVFELGKRLERPALFEMSTFGHHLWYVRSRMGAWDVPPRAAKRFIDAHVIANRDCGPMFMPPHLGWWGVFDWDNLQPERTFPDTIDYLCCKCIGTDCGLSLLVGFTPESYAKSPNTQRLGGLIRQYEDLRRSNTVSDEVKTRLAVPGAEFTLENATNGTPQFRPMHYDAHKIDALTGAGETWHTDNPYTRQPVKLRIEALASVAAYDDPKSVVVEDFKDPAQFTERSSQTSVTAAFRTAGVPPALSGCRLTATSTHPDPENAWALFSKKFTPPLNLAGRGLGVWIEGDGEGEVLNFQLKSPDSLGGGLQDHYVDIDFTGSRYFELVEPESERLVQYGWPHTTHQADWETKGVNVGNVYKSVVTWADASHIETLTIGCINLPAGKTVDCRIDPIKSLPTKAAQLTNPSISVGGVTLTFPVTIESGDYLEFHSAEDCKVYNAKGELLKVVAPEGSIPTLQPGDNELRFFADAAQDRPHPRVRVTAIASGEPFSASASSKQWQSMASAGHLPIPFFPSLSLLPCFPSQNT